MEVLRRTDVIPDTMDNTPIIDLTHIDSFDVDDVIHSIETSFNFKFEKEDLQEVKTFGDLCDCTTKRLNRIELNDCTSQQVFYKIRSAIHICQNESEVQITPTTRLEHVFPDEKRIKYVKDFEQHLGFKSNLLRPKFWISGTLTALTVVSFVFIFINWQIGLPLLTFSILIFVIAIKFAKQLKFTTVGELADNLSQEKYFLCPH